MKKILTARALITGGLAMSMVLAVLLQGCGKSGESGDSISRSGNGRGGGQSGPSSTAGTNGAKGNNPANQPSVSNMNQNPGQWGTITPITSTDAFPAKWNGGLLAQQNPNDMMRLFVTTNLEPTLVGSTTLTPETDYSPVQTCSTPGVSCSVQIAMPLTLGGVSSLSAATKSANRTQISQGTVSIVMFDSLVNTPASDGTMITPFPIYVNIDPTGSSYVSQNTLVVNFVDQLGTITITGTINGSTVSGTVDFNNTGSFSPSLTGGGSGRLGTFQMNTCSIFTTQCS